ncbi:phytanoyl-CoA dioxygenase family protein [Paenibacillus thermotolerans]|uniref:phytanoyl-CoA dioxygenase family protein n=1 Tax=Paenibacillus thermotolerans TaxID=3027807 RepID=UPI002367F019|nr:MULTISPECIES: phytanoyl-CoA dioxygenase family protein [unclassified Paenibacillus]
MTVTQAQRQRYTVKVDEYVSYHRDGYLIVRGLLPKEDAERLLKWMDDVYHGRIDDLDHLSPVFDWMDEKQKTERFSSARLHMPHRHSATAEWGLLHPRVIDVLEALIGPDVYALQSMMFLNPPGKGGQGWHQDAFYIQTQPDTLIGAWMALDRADEENGCLWVAPGSHNEPIYPPEEAHRGGFVHVDDKQIEGLFTAENVSNMDDTVNNLSGVAAKYGKPVPVVLEPGDVLFFHSHLLHRSYKNTTTDRMRRSYVTHYCNARSWVPWTHGEPYEGEAANHMHILARGRTHYPYALPQFGTPVELSSADGKDGDNGSVMVAMPGGEMGKMEM